METILNKKSRAAIELMIADGLIAKDTAERYFPELAESEDENIRKEIIDFLWKEKIFLQEAHSSVENNPKYRFVMDAIAWLEKQGEQKPADKVEQKFKVGDFIVNDYCMGKVIGLTNDVYLLDTGQGIPFSCEHNAHLWTIQDAKDGDVLDANGAPFIYKKHDKDYVYFYCGVNLAGEFIEANGIDTWNNNYKVYPATKEQREQLEKAMADAGYIFDFERKDLKKIENEIEIPFGAKDSELQEVTYYIPKGFHAEINDDKVVIKKGEKSIAWSEEDETGLTNTIIMLKEGASLHFNKKDIVKAVDWLRTIRPQNVWISVDKEVYVKEPILAQKKDKSDPFSGFVVCCDHTLTPNVYERYMILDNIVSQNNWKPSDEQMDVLLSEVTAWTKGCPKQIVLESLYNDLKKLKD